MSQERAPERPWTVAVMGHRFPSLKIEEEILGDEARVIDAEAAPDRDATIATADAIIIGSTGLLDADAIDRLENCKAIVRCGIGVDNIDVPAADARSIWVANVPNYCIEEVSDHTVTLMLALARNLIPSVAAATKGRWGVEVARSVRRLSGLNVGLIGFGRIARAVANKIEAIFGDVVAYDPVDTGDPHLRSLDEVIARADLVSLHCPLTSETRGLVNTSFLRRMREGSWLINTARGAIIDEEALIDSLDRGHLAGAALDVLRQEPPDPASPMLGHPKIVVTPHTSYYSKASIDELHRSSAEQVRAALRGERPEFVIDPNANAKAEE